MILVVGSKTEDMSDDDWKLLCSYKLSTIRFGFPKANSTSLTCLIANGNLDGNDYFVCWDKINLDHLLHATDHITSKSRELLFQLKSPKAKMIH